LRRSARAILVATLLFAACNLGHRVRMIRDRQPRSGRQALRATIDLPAGKLEISRGRPQDLFDLKLSYCRDHFKARSVFRPTGQKPEDIEEASLFITAESLSEGDRGGVGISREPNWLSLNLGTGVSLDLRLALGEAEALLDMTALSVTRMDVHAGSGPVTIRFMAGNPRNLGRLQFIAGSGPVRLEGLGWGRVVSLEFHGGAGEAFMDWNGPGPSEAAALLDAGAGGLYIKFPEELGVSVRGMGKILPSPPGRFHGDAEAWVSSNWETGERRLTLILDRGQSPVRVSWGR